VSDPRKKGAGRELFSGAPPPTARFCHSGAEHRSEPRWTRVLQHCTGYRFYFVFKSLMGLGRFPNRRP